MHAHIVHDKRYTQMNNYLIEILRMNLTHIFNI